MERVGREINTRLVEHLIVYVEYINQAEERGQMRGFVERFIAFPNGFYNNENVRSLFRNGFDYN